MRPLLIILILSSFVQAQLQPTGATVSVKGSLPPKPTADLDEDQIAKLSERLEILTKAFTPLNKHPRAADAEIFLKAVRYAIEFHEWYDKQAKDGFVKANTLLDEAESRIDGLAKNQTPWINGTGQKIFGFYSKIDGSAQPYGVEIPTELDMRADRKIPLWIWLHGRGDVSTDLNFVSNRLNAKKPGQFQPPGTIVIHPFGRYCNGWKSAGETDVFEARDDAMARYPIDPDRIAIAGFSMGGAGAWHLGAHFADQWACVHTGAGFADVKRYQKLTPDTMPVWYEQKLWGVYDVPNYARNFFNVPLIAYSGEVDTQRDAAEYMIEVLGNEGLYPPHLIGPEMGHRYHPEVIKDVQARIVSEVAKGRNTRPAKVFLQTRTLAYSRMHWLEITSLKYEWRDARAEATWDESTGTVQVQTKNVDGLKIYLPNLQKVTINDQESKISTKTPHSEQGWAWSKDGNATQSEPSKRPRLQGPIDDAFKSRFVVVLPDGQPDHSAADEWSRNEANHFLKRWRSLMRGDVVVRQASEIGSHFADEDSNLVVWGTPATNSLLRKLLTDGKLSKVLQWNEKSVRIGGQQATSNKHIPVLCYPNPLNPNRYVIINSGLTFREAHDRTNSLQNPKLPDWAILDISEPPNAESAGRVVAADFFDKHWQVIPRAVSPSDRSFSSSSKNPESAK